jgi:hypothetical protein
MDLFGLVLYGGTIAAGSYRGKDVTIQDVFEAVGANAAGKITDQELHDLENVACPSAGACGGQYTANTMSTVMEMIGLSPMGFNSVPAMDARKEEVAFRCGEVVMNLLRNSILPRRILTRAAFENAIASVAATGGSTNAVLHLLAIAREAEVDLEIDDFQTVSERTPLLADLKPSGKYVAADVDKAGGIPVIAKRLLDAKCADGSTLTVTGRTFAEEANDAKETPGQLVIAPLDRPLKKTGGLVILKGNLAPEGCVAKISGHERLEQRGPARVFESEEDAMAAVTGKKIKSGDVVVIRNEGPKGGPGMREMLSVTGAIVGEGLGSSVALLTDGRFSARWRHDPLRYQPARLGSRDQRQGSARAHEIVEAAAATLSHRRVCQICGAGLVGVAGGDHATAEVSTGEGSLIRRPARGAERFLDKCVACRADYAAVVIEHDFDGHVLKQRFHAAFVQERLHEHRILHLGHDFRRYTSPDENAPGGHELQSAVPGLSTEDAHEDRQRLIADRGLALQCQLRNQRGSIGRRVHLLSQPLRLVRFVCIPKKIVNILDPGPGENSFATDAAVLFLKVG